MARERGASSANAEWAFRRAQDRRCVACPGAFSMVCTLRFASNERNGITRAIYGIRMKVLFVCTANICRSPTAEGVFRKLVADSPLAAHLEIDSAGTHGYHAGNPPDARAIEHAALRGYELDQLRARQITPGDFEHFDFILAMDDANVRQLKAMCPTRLSQKIELLLDYGVADDGHEVPDPFQGKPRDFEHALNLIESACGGLLTYLQDLQRLQAAPPTRAKE